MRGRSVQSITMSAERRRERALAGSIGTVWGMGVMKGLSLGVRWVDGEWKEELRGWVFDLKQTRGYGVPRRTMEKSLVYRE